MSEPLLKSTLPLAVIVIFPVLPVVMSELENVSVELLDEILITPARVVALPVVIFDPLLKAMALTALIVTSPPWVVPSV